MAHRPRPSLSRRTFLATSLGAALAACGDNPLRPGPVDADAGDADASSDADTSSEPDADDTNSEADAAPDTQADAAAAPDTALAETTAEVHIEPDPEPFDPGLIPEAGRAAFPVGVWSSDPTSDDQGSLALTLACRYLGEAPLELVVFRITRLPNDGPPLGPPVHTTTLTPDEAGFVAFDLRSAALPLRPHTEHAFVFVTAEARSPVGRFRTPPAVDATPTITIGVSSCSSYTFRPFRVLERAAERDLDAFILLGDTTYADSARSLQDYRENWQRNLQQPGYEALRPRFPTIASWDDHEVDDDWNPETFDSTRLTHARRCFFEHTTPRSASPRLWRSLRFGHTVEVFVLDCRAERRPSTRNSDRPIYISEAQSEWLIAGLRDSPCIFKLVANTVSIAKWPPLYLASNDRWQGYARQREHVLANTSDVLGVIWVGGDFHFGAVHQVDPPGGDFHHLTEVLVGPVAHVNPALSVVELTGDRRQFHWLSGERNVGELTFDPAARELTIEHIGANGAILNRHVLSV